MATKKRIISALLLASMMLSLAACGGSGDKDPKDTSGKDTTVSVGDSLPAGIEKQDYKGTVNILMPDWSLYTKCFDPGDDMTDILNKSLYNREIKVEEYLGVDITYEHVDGINKMLDPISTAISTNDDLYQIALTHCISANSALVTNGYVTDMNELDIDFTADWFNQNANETLEVMGKQFFCISDYMIPDPNVILFNSRILEEKKLEDPYEIVRNGEWTLDKMIEMISGVAVDNGDTVWDHNDIYGFGAPDNWNLTNFIHAADVQIIDKNAEGEFELVFDSERAYNLMDKLDILLNGSDTFVFDYRGAQEVGTTYTEEALTIDTDRCLFTILGFSSFWNIRNTTVEFGILPFPKFDENQEDYRALDWSGVMSVPFSVKEESYEMVGDVIELLAYYSEEEVIPAYIEDTLGTKFARDPNWADMIEIIFDSIVFDPTLTYFGFDASINKLLYVPDFMIVKTGENNFASWLATHGEPSKASIATFNEAVAGLAN